MKLKDLVEQYGEYEVTETKGDWRDAGHVTLELKKPKSKTVWDLKGGDGFYCLCSNGKILYYRFASYNGCEIENGNAFLTKEEAEKDAERRKVETLLLKHGGRRWFKRGEYNCAINLRLLSWDGDGELVINYQIHFAQQGTIYFNTKEQAEKAISEIGEERIKKALFEVR